MLESLILSLAVIQGSVVQVFMHSAPVVQFFLLTFSWVHSESYASRLQFYHLLFDADSCFILHYEYPSQFIFLTGTLTPPNPTDVDGECVPELFNYKLCHMMSGESPITKISPRLRVSAFVPIKGI